MKINMTALSRATWLTIIWITFMTLLSEVSSGFKDFLVSLTGHHWTAKGILTLLFMFVVYFILTSVKEKKFNALKEIQIVAVVVLLGFASIFGFFAIHTFGA